MRKVNVTFSIPESLNYALHAHVGKMKLSQFVSGAIEKALEKDTMDLREAYRAANHDEDRLDLIKDWAALDGVWDVQET